MTTPPPQSNRKKPVNGRSYCSLYFSRHYRTLFTGCCRTGYKSRHSRAQTFAFTDEQGKPEGIFVDLIEDIAAKEGWNIVWVHGTSQENLDRLATGEIDLVIAITDTQEREKVYDFNRESAVATWAQVYAVPGKENRHVPGS